MAFKVIEPLGLRLLVEPLKKQEEKLDSGIVLAETVNADLTTGIVIKCSNELKKFFEEKGIPDYPKEGSTVLFSTGSGLGQHMNGKYLLWLTIQELWGCIVKEEK